MVRGDKSLITCVAEKEVFCIHEIDNKLFAYFFQFMLTIFCNMFTGTKRFHWITITKVQKVKEFFQQTFDEFKNERAYKSNDALLFKLIFSSYTKRKMSRHFFARVKLNEKWECID